MTPDGGHDLAEVGRALAEAFGVSLSSGLDRTLREGLRSAASQMGITPDALARRVAERDRESLDALIEHAVVPETYFWRHPDQLAALSAVALGGAGPLEIWSAGCSSGEEPYSLAIALLEAGRAGRGDRIVATDVSERLLASARRGTYGPWSIRRLPRALADRYLAGSEVRSVAGEVRALVEFRRHNLVAEPAPGAFDVVVCRNVLIYFEALVAAEVLYRLVEAVRPGGLLLVGPVELALASPLGLEWVEASSATLLRRPR